MNIVSEILGKPEEKARENKFRILISLKKWSVGHALVWKVKNPVRIKLKNKFPER